MIRIKAKIKLNTLFLVTFFVIYQPNLSSILPFPKNTIMLTIICLVLILLLNRHLIVFLIKTNMITFIFLQLCLLLYLLIVQAFNHLSIDSVSNNIMFIIQTINISGIFLLLNKYTNKSIEKQLNFVINLGFVQAILIILMSIFPAFKEIANQLYGKAYFSWFTLTRVYGLAGDFTFMLPVVMCFIAALSYYIYLQTGKNLYLIKSIFIAASSILNGRTGLMLYLVAVVIITIIKMKKISLLVLIKYLMAISITSSILVFLYKTVESINSVFLWFADSIGQLYNFVFYGEAVGNMSELGDAMLFFPEGLHWIFGYGVRTFGDIGLNFYGKTSDIGYINDLQKGGLFYILICYSVIFCFIKLCGRKSILYNIIILVFLIGSNYKGETMTGSYLILILILVKYITEYNNTTNNKQNVQI